MAFFTGVNVFQYIFQKRQILQKVKFLLLMYKMDEYGPNQQLILEALKLPELETNIQILNQVNLDCA